MSVLDASFVVEALVGTGDRGTAARRRLQGESMPAAPQILKAEALSGIRSMTLRGEIAELIGRRAVSRLRRLGVPAYPIEPLMNRIWELRSTISVYDAWYVALAERLSTTLVTTDRRLAGANGPRCEIEVIGN
ncbi:MAG: type II toxin-antitoxin system VapC family toxin [Actinomycetota bacterium]